MEEPHEPPVESATHLMLRLPDSAAAWAATLLAVLALVLGFATSGETLSRWVPGLIAFLAVVFGLRAGIARDERSIFMWIPLVLSGTYLFLLVVTAGF